MVTIEKCLSSSCADYKIFKEEKLIGVVFEDKGEEGFPARFQVSGDGQRIFYSTMEDCIKHFV